LLLLATQAHYIVGAGTDLIDTEGSDKSINNCGNN
jgi:hypothetical protein